MIFNNIFETSSRKQLVNQAKRGRTAGG